MPVFRIRRTRIQKWEQLLRIEAPHREAAIDCAENGESVPPREWSKVCERTETKILEVLRGDR